LSSVTALDGVMLATGCELYGLSAVVSLDNLTLAKDCVLGDLSASMRRRLVALQEGPRE